MAKRKPAKAPKPAKAKKAGPKGRKAARKPRARSLPPSADRDAPVKEGMAPVDREHRNVVREFNQYLRSRSEKRAAKLAVKLEALREAKEKLAHTIFSNMVNPNADADERAAQEKARAKRARKISASKLFELAIFFDDRKKTRPFRFIATGDGGYIDRKTGEEVSGAKVRQVEATRAYWRYIRFIARALKVSLKEARKLRKEIEAGAGGPGLSPSDKYGHMIRGIPLDNGEVLAVTRKSSSWILPIDENEELNPLGDGDAYHGIVSIYE